MSTNVGAISATLALEDLLTKAADKATQALNRFGKETTEASRQSDKLDKSNERTSKSFASLERGISNVAGKLAGIALGFMSVNAAMSLVEKSIDAISESETATALLEARIKSTGGVAGKTVDEINRFAESLSKLIKRDDEEIALAAAELLKFTDISGNQFERIIKLAADMAGPTGDLVAEVERLGKAFQEPDEALTLLARSVGKFTDAEEIAIKSLAKSGDEAGAAAKMMEILERRVGDTAEAWGKTLPGAIAGAKIAWENQLELLQEGLSPAIKQLAEDFDDWLEKAENQEKIIQLGRDLGETLLKVGDAVKNVKTIFDEISGGELAKILLTVIDLVAEFTTLKAKVEDMLGPWARLFNNPFVEYTIVSLKAIASLLGLIEGKSENLAKKPPIPKIDTSVLATIPGFGLASQGGGSRKPDHNQIDAGAVKRAEQLRSELARLEAQLKLNTDQALEMAGALNSGVDEEQVNAIKRAHALHSQWLQDVQRFGKAAADQLALLRRQQLDAEAVADRAEDEWNEVADAVEAARNKFLAPIVTGWEIDTKALNDAIEIGEKELSILEEIKGRRADEAELIATANKLREDGLITDAEHSEYLRQFADFWEQLPQQISASEALVREMGQTLASSADAGVTALADGLVDAATGGENAFDDFADSLEKILKRMIADWLAQWFRAMAQWLARWIATQQTAQAASAATSAMGGGGGGAGSYASLFGMAGQAMGGGGAGAGAGASGAGAGASGAGMGAAASFGAVAAIFAIVYFGVKQWIETSKKYSAEVTFQLRQDADAAVNDIAGNAKQIAGLTQSVKDASESVNDFLAQLGGELEGFSGKVTIGSKGRGKNTSFFIELENGVKEWFKTYEEALEGALLAALKTSKVLGFSPLMQQGLNEIDADSFDDLNKFLGDLKEISELDWTDSARQVQATTAHFLDLWSSLDKLQTITPDVLNSFDQLGAGIVNAFQSWFDRIEGKEKPKSKEDRLAALQTEAKIANAQKHLMEARIRSEIFGLEAEKRILEARIKLTVTEGLVEVGSLKNKNKFLNIRADQIQAEASLEQQRIEFIDAEIAALTEILNNLPKDIDIPSLKLPNLGGGNDPFASLRDFIKDRRFELSLRGLSDYRRSLKELDREYAERMKEAKGNKKLQAELLALEKEERRQLNEAKRKQTLSDVKSFLGTKTGFDEIRETAGKLIDDIEESPFGDVRKQKLIGRVLADLDRQLDDLAKKSAISLFGEMLGDLEKFGVDQALQTEIRNAQATLEHVLKMEHYRAEIEILRAEGRLTTETMALLDRSLAELEKVDPTKLFGAPPPNYDFTSVLQARRAENEEAARKKLEDEANKLADAIRSATDKLKSYQDDELSPFAQRMREINADFDEIVKALGNTSEVISTYNNAVDRAKDDARDLLSGYTNDNEDPLQSVIDGITSDFDEIREALGDTPDVLDAFSSAIIRATKEAYQALTDFHDDLTGLGSSATIEQQFNAIKAQLDKTISEVEAGNTAKISDLVSQGRVFEELLGKMFGTSTGGFIEGRSDLRDRVSDILAGAGLISSTGASSQSTSLTPFTQLNSLTSASNHIADVMQLTGTRQETVLIDIREILSEIANEIREFRESNLTLKIG